MKECDRAYTDHRVLQFWRRVEADRADGSLPSLDPYRADFTDVAGDIEREYRSSERLERVDRYRVIRKVGSGAQGDVYEAVEDVSNRVVALKLVGTRHADGSLTLDRFRREVEALSELEDQGICPVFACGEAGDMFWIAMKYLPGPGLDEVLRARRRKPTPLSAKEILERIRWLVEICRGVHAAHAAGYLHRDIKPGNIRFDGGGRPVLLDFGLAKPLSPDPVNATMRSSGAGTPSYAAPEQWAGDDLTCAADVWSLGVIAYETLTGSRPFTGSDDPSLGRSIRAAQPPDPHDAQLRLPRAARDVLAKAMDKDPEKRHASAEHLAVELEELAKRVKDPGRARSRASRRVLAGGAFVVLFVVLGPALYNHAFISASPFQSRAQLSARGFAGQWDFVGTSGPSPRSDHAMATDETTGDIILFGGYRDRQDSDQTWVWRAARQEWIELKPSRSPCARAGHAMAYDPDGKRIVLFGGQNQKTGMLNDTWVFVDSNWTQLSIEGPTPARRMHAAMAGVPEEGIVLFGGNPDGSMAKPSFQETWTLSGSKWKLERTPPALSGRYRAELIYFPPLESCILAFGADFPDVTVWPKETWRWSRAEEWMRMPGANHPERGGVAASYNPHTRRIVAFGGFRGTHLGDTLEFDGATWRKPEMLQGDPPRRNGAAMAFHRESDRAVVFGGIDGTNGETVIYGETWTYSVLASYAPWSSRDGCVGSHKMIPSLGPNRKNPRMPRIGKPFEIMLTRAPQSGGALLITGFSALSRPLRLSSRSMPSCLLYIREDVLTPIEIDATGSATATFHIPDNPSLVGTIFYNQAFVPDTVDDRETRLVSNATRGVIGR